MSGLEHLRNLAEAKRPDDEGLLGNARCTWGRSELIGEETLAAFAAKRFDLQGDHIQVESEAGAALIGQNGALVADLYDGRIGRLWRVGSGAPTAPEPAIDIAFDTDMSQQRGDLHFRREDHLSLDEASAERLLAAAHEWVEQLRVEGRLRVRAFVLRAFANDQASAALLSLFTMSNEAPRSAAFSYAAIGIGADRRVIIVQDPPLARPWTPRF